MTFHAFMDALEKEKFLHLYLLAGEESYYIERARKRILEHIFPDGVDSNLITRLSASANPEEVLETLRATSLFSPINVVIAPGTLLKEGKQAGDALKHKDTSEERLIKELGALPEGVFLIIEMREKPDKRRKLYKAVAKAGLVLEAAPMRAWNIDDWLREKLQSINKTLEPAARAYFAAAVSMMKNISLSYLDKEFDKIALFSSERMIRKREIESIFASVPEVSIFALADAISERSSKKAMTILLRELHDGTHFTVILAVLTRHVRQIWQALLLQKQGIRGSALAKPLNLNPYIAGRLGRAAVKFKEETLKRAFLALCDADYKMKTGRAGSEALAHAVILLCKDERGSRLSP